MSLHKRETAGRQAWQIGDWNAPQGGRLIGKHSKSNPTNKQKAKKRNR